MAFALPLDTTTITDFISVVRQGDFIILTYTDNGSRFRQVAVPVSGLTITVNYPYAQSVNFMLHGEQFLIMTYDESQADGGAPIGENFIVPDPNQAFVWLADIQKTLAYFTESEVSTNLLYIERRQQQSQTIDLLPIEILTRSGAVQTNCTAVRFLNRGTTNAIVNGYPIAPGENYDIPALGAGFIYGTAVRVVFEDATTGILVKPRGETVTPEAPAS